MLRARIGIGVCFTCVLPIRGRDGVIRMRRGCIDGPVFNGARVAWDESRWELGPEPEPDEEVLPEVERLTETQLWGEA